ncbi:uncharacterized protein BJX67DRAFT_307320 [Aspergillus lucknowensis]|uniref:Uncharacterized protein n=1 Tax=Aspergillus lucknowensis TaxID=176173 RepID=A0ABR4LZY0_9EURO
MGRTGDLILGDTTPPPLAQTHLKNISRHGKFGNLTGEGETEIWLNDGSECARCGLRLLDVEPLQKNPIAESAMNGEANRRSRTPRQQWLEIRAFDWIIMALLDHHQGSHGLGREGIRLCPSRSCLLHQALEEEGASGPFFQEGPRGKLVIAGPTLSLPSQGEERFSPLR